MNEKAIDNFVDLLFNFDMKELENETKFLENYKKLQQENQQLKSVIKEIREYIKEKEKDGTLWSVKSTDEMLQILDKGDK